MTWLGKILLVLVLLVSLAWAWLTVAVHVGITNWKTRAETLKKANDQLVARVDEERTRRNTEVADLTAQLASARQEARVAGEQTRGLARNDSALTALITALDSAFKLEDNQVAAISGFRAEDQKQASNLLVRNTELENQKQNLEIDRQTAYIERDKAENESKRLQQSLDTTERRLEATRDQLREAQARVGTGSGGTLQGISGEKPPEPLAPGTRAKVTGYQEGFVTLDIGLDAGLQPNSVLDINRLTGGGKYVGQVRVLPEGLYRKQAVGTFIPPGGRPLNSLRADELPQKGDNAVKPR